MRSLCAFKNAPVEGENYTFFSGFNQEAGEGGGNVFFYLKEETGTELMRYLMSSSSNWKPTPM